MDADENKAMIEKLIKNKIKDNCTVNFVSAPKMVQVLDKYVTTNEAHTLETFFDHVEMQRVIT